MAELATSQPSWERWLGDSHFSHFSHLLWLGHRDCSHPPEPWLVIIRWQPMAAVPRGRGRQARSHLCVWRGRRTAAIELSPAMLRRMAALTVCPSHSRWLKCLSPSHLTQDGCDIASSAMRARPGACGMAAVVRLQPSLLRMAALCVLQPSAWRLWLRCS